MENRASVTGWQKLFFSYKKMLFGIVSWFLFFCFTSSVSSTCSTIFSLILRVLNFTIWEISKNP